MHYVGSSATEDYAEEFDPDGSIIPHGIADLRKREDVAMGLFDAFASSAAARQIAELAQQVSRRSCTAVWHKVQARASEMGLAQARGYIYAHAAEAVEAEVARSGVSVQRRQELSRLAREAVVEMLVCEVARAHRMQTSRRRAA